MGSRPAGCFLLRIILGCFIGLTACRPSMPSQSSDTAVRTADITLYKLGNRNAPPFGDYYLDTIQPILARRCVVCHSCTNGPCQLNMTSYQGLKRGINKTDPYALRLLAGEDTRLANNLDIAVWRARGFLSILPDSDSRLQPEDSVIYRNVLRGQNNLASRSQFGEAEIRRMVKAHENSAYECPATLSEYARFEAKYPQGGMPCALPALDPLEAQTLLTWIRQGAQGPSDSARRMALSAQKSSLSQGDPASVVASWDALLGADDLKFQLVARYIYEHLFLANIQFVENPGEYYRMVRSWTPAPQAITQIVTDAVQDDPGAAGRIYYRMQKIDRVIEAKTHIVLNLSLADIAKYKSIFYQTEWGLDRLPDYTSKNPFAVFAAIPAAARASFMQHHARVLMQSEARGPICFFQPATYGADTYFLLMFLDVKSDPSVVYPMLGLDSWDALFAKDTNWKTILSGDKNWVEGRFRQAFEDKLRVLRPGGLGIEDIWMGDGKDPNALLVGHRYQTTVEFDHAAYRSLTGYPRSVNLISYATFERSFYNGVGQYLYWDGVKHKTDSWDWSVYLRTEKEDLYVSLFPDQSYRDQLRERLTGPLGRMFYWLFRDYAKGRPSPLSAGITEDTLLKKIFLRMGPAIVGTPDALNNWPDTAQPKGIPQRIDAIEQFEAGVRALTGTPQPFAGFFPNIVYVRLMGETLYSFTISRGYIPNKIILLEKQSRNRQEDVLQVSRGLRGIAPEMFVDLSLDQTADFLRELMQVQNLEKWRAFAAHYRIARNSPAFWPFVDWLHAYQQKNMPAEAGVLELKYYDRSDMPF